MQRLPRRAVLCESTDVLSGDFWAHSSYRVAGNAVATGAAAGVRAAVATAPGRLPHELSFTEIADPLAKLRQTCSNHASSARRVSVTGRRPPRRAGTALSAATTSKECTSCRRRPPNSRTIRAGSWLVLCATGRRDTCAMTPKESWGNGFRAAGAIACLETALGCPVITSNQVLLWNLLGQLGAELRITGYGQLVAHLPWRGAAGRW
jgi:FAD dependent oxidoreductase